MAVLLVVALQPRLQRCKIVLPILVFALFYVATWLVLRTDPGAFVYWLAD